MPKIPAKQVDLSSFETKTPYFTEFNFGTGDGTDDIDWATNGLRQRITLGANTTFTFTAPPGHCNLLLKVIKPGTEYTVAWPASVEWGDDGAPDMSGINRTHIVTFYWDGFNYYGAYKLGFTP